MSNAPTPRGWRPGADEADMQLARELLYTYWVDHPGRPYDALPAGYAAYTVVLHPLMTDDRPDGGPWLTDATIDPWARIIELHEKGLPGDRWVANVGLGEEVTVPLADDLQVGSSSTGFVVAGYYEEDVWTVTAAAMYELLLNIESAWPPDWLTSFFPLDRRWLALAPYDQGLTIVASDYAAARRLRTDARLETLFCNRSQMQIDCGCSGGVAAAVAVGTPLSDRELSGADPARSSAGEPRPVPLTHTARPAAAPVPHDYRGPLTRLWAGPGPVHRAGRPVRRWIEAASD